MSLNTPLTWLAGTLAAGDMNDHIRDATRWLGGFAAGPKGISIVSSSVPFSLTTSPGWTTIAYDTADYNAAVAGDELWDAGSPEFFMFPQDCVALFGAGIRTDPTTANKALRFIINSDDGLGVVEHDNIGISTPAYTSIAVTRLFPFSAGDTLETQGYQDSGAPLNVIVEGKSSPQMWVIWMAVNGI